MNDRDKPGWATVAPPEPSKRADGDVEACAVPERLRAILDELGASYKVIRALKVDGEPSRALTAALWRLEATVKDVTLYAGQLAAASEPKETV